MCASLESLYPNLVKVLFLRFYDHIVLFWSCLLYETRLDKTPYLPVDGEVFHIYHNAPEDSCTLLKSINTNKLLTCVMFPALYHIY